MHSEDVLWFVNSRLYKEEICLFSLLPKPQCLEQCPVQTYVTGKKKSLNEFSKRFYTPTYYRTAHSKYQVIIKLIVVIIIRTCHGLSANYEEGSVLSALHTEFHLILLTAQRWRSC